MIGYMPKYKESRPLVGFRAESSGGGDFSVNINNENRLVIKYDVICGNGISFNKIHAQELVDALQEIINNM